MALVDVTFFQKPLARLGRQSGRLVSIVRSVSIAGLPFDLCELDVEQPGKVMVRVLRFVERRAGSGSLSTASGSEELLGIKKNAKGR